MHSVLKLHCERPGFSPLHVDPLVVTNWLINERLVSSCATLQRSQTCNYGRQSQQQM